MAFRLTTESTYNSNALDHHLAKHSTMHEVWSLSIEISMPKPAPAGSTDKPSPASSVCQCSIKGYETRAPPFAGLHCTLAAQALSALQSETFFGAADDLTTLCVFSNRLVVLCTGRRRRQQIYSNKNRNTTHIRRSEYDDVRQGRFVCPPSFGVAVYRFAPAVAEKSV